MRQRIRSTPLRFIYEIGLCTKCIRQAFVATLIAWSVIACALALDSVFGVQLCGSFLLLPAVALSSLWATHLVVFAMRSALRPKEALSHTTSDQNADELVSAARRSFLGAFASSLSTIALATMFPSIASAQNRYWCGPTDSRGTYCAAYQHCCYAYYVSNPYAYCCANGCGPDQDGDCR